MADTEHKSVEVIADCEKTSEPVSKKPRSSFLQNCGPDVIYREQITSGDEPAGSCPVEVSIRPEGAEPGVATESAQGNDNEPVTSELTNDYSNADTILMSGSESKVLGT